MNWKLKALAQTAIAATPFGQAIYDNLKAFTLRASEAERNHFEFVQDLMSHLNRYLKRPPSQLGICEIGTGWVPTVTLMLRAGGFERVFAFDVESHLRSQGIKIASDQIAAHQAALAVLFEKSDEEIAAFVHRLRRSASLPIKAFKQTGIVYLIAKEFAQAALPQSSVDVIFSRAVLEHIPEAALEPTIQKCYSALHGGGVMIHLIDHSDHFAYGDQTITPLNFYRFSAAEWQRHNSPIMHQNRLPSSHYLKLFESSGFEICHISYVTFNGDIDFQINRDFIRYDLSELRKVSTFVIARKRP